MVFLAGSIFGGTGASGFPTIAKIVKDKLNVKVAGALILPYFRFKSNDDELKAESEEFLINTETALKHYQQRNKTGDFDAVYLFGDESRVNVENALGGPDQKNAPHFIELYAALAARHFFIGGDKDGQTPQYFIIAREHNNQLKWTDLPDDNKGKTVRKMIGQLAHFAFAFLSVYKPALQQIPKSSRDTYRATWYVDFFERMGNRIRR